MIAATLSLSFIIWEPDMPVFDFWDGSAWEAENFVVRCAHLCSCCLLILFPRLVALVASRHRYCVCVEGETVYWCLRRMLLGYVVARRFWGRRG